ncbi:MAG TPA: class I SAM-dependent methyltransferase [Alphaproteobacteria bacterium]|nr:class I SAM-dependent methyltransferase [Alphaproteobacteria bacterium]
MHSVNPKKITSLEPSSNDTTSPLDLYALSPETIGIMSYNELIGLVRETNRPPGGSNAIMEIAHQCFLNPSKTVLEIGTSTGITAIELAQLTGCKVVGIDINENSLAEAQERANRKKVGHLCTFQKDDATALSFPDESFDVVFCGNVTSLVSNRDKALAEYARVLKPGGLLAAIPMYYIKEPSDQLVDDVRKAIRVNITPQYRQDWEVFFKISPFVTLSQSNFCFDELPAATVDAFCKTILERPHLQSLPVHSREALNKIYTQYMQLFRINLAHMGFSTLILRKESADIDAELFTSTKI